MKTAAMTTPNVFRKTTPLENCSTTPNFSQDVSIQFASYAHKRTFIFVFATRWYSLRATAKAAVKITDCDKDLACVSITCHDMDALPIPTRYCKHEVQKTILDSASPFL